MVKRGDVVYHEQTPGGPFGLVRRVSRKHRWADVCWRTNRESWTKRVPTKWLHTAIEADRELEFVSYGIAE